MSMYALLALVSVWLLLSCILQHYALCLSGEIDYLLTIYWERSHFGHHKTMNSESLMKRCGDFDLWSAYVYVTVPLNSFAALNLDLCLPLAILNFVCCTGSWLPLDLIIHTTWSFSDPCLLLGNIPLACLGLHTCSDPFDAQPGHSGSGCWHYCS